jgi:hypothetical protein
MEFRRSGEGIALLDIHLSYCVHWHAVDNPILNLSKANRHRWKTESARSNPLVVFTWIWNYVSVT